MVVPGAIPAPAIVIAEATTPVFTFATMSVVDETEVAVEGNMKTGSFTLPDTAVTSAFESRATVVAVVPVVF